MLFAPDGSIVGEYLKQHPVPFGEFVPLRDLFEFIPQLDQVPRDLRPGRGAGCVPGGGRRPVLPPGLGHLLRGGLPPVPAQRGAAGAQLVVVATNEGSYGRGPASDQLIGMVRLNAAALGWTWCTPRSPATPPSCGPTGRWTRRRPGSSPPRSCTGRCSVQESRRTLYAVTGDWLELAAIAVALDRPGGGLAPPARLPHQAPGPPVRERAAAPPSGPRISRRGSLCPPSRM